MADSRRALVWAWSLSIGAAAGLRAWNALTGPLLHGYDAWAHIAYVLFLDLYHALPYADQGWSYFHPPLYYLLGFVIAQLGDADVLARGLALLGGAASVGVAAVVAWLVLVALLLVAALPTGGRTLHWIDAVTIGAGVTWLALLHAGVDVLLAHAARGRSEGELSWSRP